MKDKSIRNLQPHVIDTLFTVGSVYILTENILPPKTEVANDNGKVCDVKTVLVLPKAEVSQLLKYVGRSGYHDIVSWWSVARKQAADYEGNFNLYKITLSCDPPCCPVLHNYTARCDGSCRHQVACASAHPEFRQICKIYRSIVRNWGYTSSIEGYQNLVRESQAIVAKQRKEASAKALAENKKRFTKKEGLTRKQSSK